MERRTKIIMGLGLAVLGIVVLSKRASGGDGDGGGGKFEFGQPSASIVGAYGGWGLLGFDCEVSNNSDVAIQRTLEVWYTMTIDYTGVIPGVGIVTTDPAPIYQPGHSMVNVSLQPGESIIYQYSGLDYEAGVEGLFLMQSDTKYNFWLQDDLDNKSEEVILNT